MIMLVISFVVASRVSVGYSTFSLQYIGQQAAEMSLQSAVMWGRGREGWVRVWSGRPLPEVYFIRKWSEMEFLSTYANIYESTHVHYNGKICTCVLLINETQVTFTWE